jgi:cyclopropane-fatty-acyl-phospholipid synthase
MADLSFDTALSSGLVAPKQSWWANALLSSVRCGRLTLVTPSGVRLTHTPTAPGPEGTMVLHRWRTLSRLLAGGDVAGGEAYMDGDWSSPDLPSLIELVARNAALVQTIGGSKIARLLNRLHHRMNANTRRGSKRNIVRHYDLGNEFYAAWLDPGMTYSSALYKNGSETLEDAQTAKQDRAIDLMALNGGERVLEIGCGWGGLAERLIHRSACHVTGLTLSPAQRAFATDRLKETGATDLRLQDYRDTAGTFDRIVSIEMLEAVGESWWPAYFGTLRDRLRPGGTAVLQAITIAEDRFEEYRTCVDFIQRYIFPGGMLPSKTEMRRQIEAAGLELRSVETFGDSYARTLAEWRRRFLHAWPEIAKQGFDLRFKRMWDYYLSYCEAGFRSAATDVGLYVVVRPA